MTGSEQAAGGVSHSSRGWAAEGITPPATIHDGSGRHPAPTPPAPESFSICPHCGYSGRTDMPMISGDLILDPRGGGWWRGEWFRFGGRPHQIAYALARARGRGLSREALHIRLETQERHHSVNPFIHFARRRLREVTGHDWIVTIWGDGWRWSPPPQTAPDQSPLPRPAAPPENAA